VSQGAAQPEAKINLLVSPSNAVFVAKAVEEKVGPPEATEDFQRQNPAAHRLMKEVDQAFDLMVKSLVREIRKIVADYP
jgi:hypothetical protein